ncbi:MAG: hypothetical protein GX236_11955 [Clostridiaceae bacterium]|nr:hypothetical protein [Clostridiaceae bacterium]
MLGLLYYDEIINIIDIESSVSQTISVYVEDGKSMRVSGTSTHREKRVIERNRIDSIKF